ncbi:hypothetical protein OPT61_g4281 [Boeremia exigua]|uniref:Uncharacterized protein n=1 Tax=Boeremia exigua TaxID=749465 RepID=A0ACC2IEJ7_9PLEO|nr:hypothetical protein OPT61_g4281 [Boeremia exigua]
MLRAYRPTLAQLHVRPILTSHSFAAMSFPHPVILCGKTEAIGAVVIENLKPEFEGTLVHLPTCFPSLNYNAVVHFIQTVEIGKRQIPALLQGENPGSSGSALGSRNYERTPVAVLLGAAFDDQGIEEMRDAAKGTKDVPWLRPDTSKPTPPPGPEYGKAMVARIKETVQSLEKEGRLEGNGEIVWF